MENDTEYLLISYDTSTEKRGKVSRALLRQKASILSILSFQKNQLKTKFGPAPSLLILSF